MGDNLYFAGLIGSGKTTLGRRVSQVLQREVLDLDEVMDARLGYSFHRLVAEQGWLAFRELEYELCKEFARRSQAVICLGGGTVRYRWNLDAIAGSGRVILLEVSLDELVRRVQTADRPRVNPGTDLAADLRMLWETHREKYYRSADLFYRAEGKSLETETRDLVEIVRERGW